MSRKCRHIPESVQPKPAFSTFRRLFAGSANGPAADRSCGAKVDTDRPAISLNAPARYFNRFVVSGRASDPTTRVSRIELWVDGKRMSGMNVKGNRYRKDWFGSTKLPPGEHRVELRAYDEAQNVGVAGATVTKLSSASGIRSATARITLRARRASGRRIIVNARVLRALKGEFTESPRGRLQLFFDRRVGRRWKQTSRYTKGIARPIRHTYVAKKAGTWRVRAVLAVDPPYRDTTGRARTVRVR